MNSVSYLVNDDSYTWHPMYGRRLKMNLQHVANQLSHNGNYSSNILIITFGNCCFTIHYIFQLFFHTYPLLACISSCATTVLIYFHLYCISRHKWTLNIAWNVSTISDYEPAVFSLVAQYSILPKNNHVSRGKLSFPGVKTLSLFDWHHRKFTYFFREKCTATMHDIAHFW